MKKLFFEIYLFLFGRKFFYRLNKAFFITGLKGLGILNFESIKTSGEKHLLKHLASQYSLHTIIDGGANIGLYSRLCKKYFPGSEIYAFEPHPVTYQKLVTNTLGKGIKTFPLALSDQSLETELFDYEESGGSSHASMFSRYFTDIINQKTRSIKVNTTTLDEFLLKEKIERVDFLKLDTEGNDFNILKGAKNALNQGLVRIIQFEFGSPNVVSRTFFKDFYDLLSPNYHLFRILPYSLLPIHHYSPLHHEIFGFQNYIAFLKTPTQ